MPNKYSHAFVLSNYESYGIINYDRPRSSQHYTSSPSCPSTNRTQKLHTPSPVSHTPTAPNRSERLRIECPPSPRIKPASPTFSTKRFEPHASSTFHVESPPSSKARAEPPPLLRRSSSVETQIYAPEASPTSSSKRSHSRTDTKLKDCSDRQYLGRTVAQKSTEPTELQNPQQLQKPQTAPKHTAGEPPSRLPQNSNKVVGLGIQTHSANQTPNSSQAPSKQDIKLSTQTSSSKYPYSHPKEPSWRHSSAVCVGGRDYIAPNSPPIRPTPIHQRRHGDGASRLTKPLRGTFDTVPVSAYAPPSPPATPESARSFSLTTSTKEPVSASQPPPVPERSARRNKPKPLLKRHSSLISEPRAHVGSARPRTSSDQQSPTGTTFSITTRTSSLNATSFSPNHSRNSSNPSRHSFDASGASPKRKSSNFGSLLFPYDDTDLESLPSTIDFNAMPWCDHNIGPAIFRDGELNSQRTSFASPTMTRNSFASPITTRASSFDSAAPPPIGINRPVPKALMESMPSVTQKTPRKARTARTSIASLWSFRSAPKAILYSQTIPGQPPIPVSVSRTAAPSIPSLFPNYKGQFPPSQDREPRSRRMSSSANRATSVKTQKRGGSVPARPSSSKRTSWFKNDAFEKAFGSVQPSDGGELGVN